MSGLRQVVLALLTLSNDGCRSLHRHNIATERNREEKEIEMETGCTQTEDARRGVRKMRLRTTWENKRVISRRQTKENIEKVRKRTIMRGNVKKERQRQREKKRGRQTVQ